MNSNKHILFSLFFLCFNVAASAEPKCTVQRFKDTRTMLTVEPTKPILSNARNYITSCRSSTPLTAGFGSPPVMAILEFRDLVASRPIIVIRPGDPLRVPDKSGVKGLPPLDLIEITIVQTDNDQIRVFAHTAVAGHLVEFRGPSEGAETQLHAEVKSTQAQQ